MKLKIHIYVLYSVHGAQNWIRVYALHSEIHTKPIRTKLYEKPKGR